jgi:DNA-binding transcriptional MerR regulator
MTQLKSTRAFRTISEAGDELDLQPHVLRFWESKFPQIQPMKRSGGRRFYRPEDIEFLRGIKILLHREKHPIKDVQKLIRIRGHQSVIDLGRSIEKAANPKAVKETNLVPPRIKPVVHARSEPAPRPAPVQQSAPVPQEDDDIVRRVVDFEAEPVAADIPPAPVAEAQPVYEPEFGPDDDDDLSIPDSRLGPADREKLETALDKLKSLKSRWEKFK